MLIPSFSCLTSTILISTALAATPAARSKDPSTRVAVTNVVLVHGAFADGSSWSKVIPLLEAKGLHAIAVQNHLNSFPEDVAATKRAIAKFRGPVVLVGHSYGGAVITEAGNDPKVVSLVYVAAFAPADGQSVADVAQTFPAPPGMTEEQLDAAGFVSLTAKGVNEDFAQDLPAVERELILATQRPTAGSVFGAKVVRAAWKSKPSWYIVAANDRMIAPQLEQAMADRMRAQTTTIASSHVPMLSHPSEVALTIEAAAKGATVE